MVKDPAVETLDKLIDAFEAIGQTLKSVAEMQKIQNRMIDVLLTRVEKLEGVQQMINDNQEQPL